MFHNGGYANCDVALRTVAISMGYNRLRGVDAIRHDYANPSVRQAPAIDRGGGCLSDLAAAPMPTRGVNSEVAEDAGNSLTRLTSKSLGPDFSFWLKYPGGFR